MNFETNRLNTFTNWPASAPVDPIRIAKAGFFFTGEGMEVQCFSCEGKISQWNYGDQVMWRHRQLKPNCAFVVNPHLSGNVPLVLGTECPSTDDSATSWSLPDVGNEPVDSSHDYGLTEEDEMYKSDALRLLSFINWEDVSVSRESLVSAGFYHAGEGRLRCAWCGGELAPFRRFGSLGQPLDVHRMYFPRCAHAASLELAQRSPSIISAPTSPPSDTPPIRSPSETNNNQPQSSGAEHNALLLNMGGRLRNLGVVSGGARHPEFASLAARLASFQRWPADRQQAPHTLAEAGFFHTGNDDQVRCFYCDGGLGKWEAGDTPWSEHARWFPHCGYVLLIKGKEFVDNCHNSSVQRTFSADSGLNTRKRNPGVDYPVSVGQLEECMESGVSMAALGAGLDAARVRRAISRRLRTTGTTFPCSEALIDAVLNEQLNEEAWSVTPTPNTLLSLIPNSIMPSLRWDRPDSQQSSEVTPPLSPSPSPVNITIVQRQTEEPDSSRNVTTTSKPQAPPENSSEKIDNNSSSDKKVSLEEENRQLKEARLCKVCMDNEVSVVFLPCGHLVSCARCGAALGACPLCRAPVRALVRAYLA